MSKFKYMEYAVGNPSNRNYFNFSKDVISMPFTKSNRYKELWRSMYLYETEKPTEKDAMLGNFYIECDETNFNLNKEIMIEVSNYLHNKYNIPLLYFDYFLTNRSIWLVLPAKVFQCFGSQKLNLIHKIMATEVYNYLNNLGYKKNIDLSIYKWNGLIHSLGSYLNNSKRWVTKFTYSDLTNANTITDLIIAKYDNCFTYQDIEPIQEASNWYKLIQKLVLNKKINNCNQKLCSNCKERLCMNKLEHINLIENNRNLHIYTYSLYLKEQGYNLEQAIDKVQNTFSNDYVREIECIRTIKSAINGNKHFNCAVVKQLLNPDIFDCSNCSKKEKANYNTFIIPREFIQLLNEKKANYKVYKLLLKILYTNQIDKKDFILNLHGDKYKKDTISYFEILKELEIINYSIKDNIIYTKLIYKDKNIYNSYIVLPKEFISSKIFFKLKHEFKLLMELLKCSIHKVNGTIYFNVKLSTLISTLKSTKNTILRYLYLLKKNKVVLGRYIVLFTSFNKIKNKIINKLKVIKNNILTIKTNKIKKNNDRNIKEPIVWLYDIPLIIPLPFKS